VTTALDEQRRADTYDWCGPLVRDIVTAEFDPAVTEILDVGACWGKYRILLPDYKMDACEVWEPYVVQDTLAAGYREVFMADICDLAGSDAWKSYDLVIMGDVLEHIGRPQAQELLDRVLQTCGEVIVVVPYNYEQGAEHGNPYQRHLQADLTPDLMASEYPRLQLCALEERDGRAFKGLYRRRETT
jgi:hypothetical protein